MNMSLLLGFVGLINMILLSPIAIYMSVYEETNTISMRNVISGNESSTSTWILFGWLLIKGLFGNLLPDYFWGRSIVLTSATVATVGLNVGIPLGFLNDSFIMHRRVLSFESASGVL